MIIRMTLGDNDFTRELEMFTKSLLSDLMFSKDEEFYGLDSVDAKIQYMDYKHKIQNLLNPNNDSILDRPSRKLICHEVQKLWNQYVRHRAISSGRFSDFPEVYLMDNFKVSVIYRMADMWENGEAVYFFTTNNKFITQ